ncbi:Cyclin N-terminal domain-containing protein 1 [Frankliniella fusca]|uniref:Cyclin N-terminal domain-containing protein 1 n=1 Tax=Frankliniella fusca TaxID=407009 RepID=A0AAE1H1I5_9NEOP|nr:Cyclin N-terminal domain-containing protein 1 [Frankliniella fusca]
MDFQFVTPANRTPLSEFSVPKSKLYDESMMDFLLILREHNSQRKREFATEGSLAFLSTPSPVVELTLNICSVFELPKEVTFLAIDIFDRFVVQHTTDLWQYSCDSSSDFKSQMKYWRRISARSQKQSLLRLLSCIQIASKIVLQSVALSPKHVEEYLHKSGHAYKLKSICGSERRVFSSLGCKVPIYTIFDYIFVLLEALLKWTNETHELFPVCDQVLEYTYLQRDEIYKQFIWMATCRWDHSRDERIKFAEVELDQFLMASAIIVTSIYILNLSSIGPNEASEILSELASVSSNDIRGLSILISQKILGEGIRSVTFKSCG